MKSFGLIYHGKQSLNVGSRETICFFYIYCYMNYANIKELNIKKLKTIHDYI